MSIEATRSDSVWGFANRKAIQKLKDRGYAVLGDFDFETGRGGHESLFDFPQGDERFHTYQRLIDSYHPFGFYGCAMGYGQGFVTQAALLLDRMKDATSMLHWTAREVFDPEIHSFVVPEGSQVDSSGRYMFRTGDHGNGVQEAEIVKMFRLLIGVDDNQPVRVSEDFFIEARKANPPQIALVRPGRDYRANPIEEVTLTANASDEMPHSSSATAMSTGANATSWKSNARAEAIGQLSA